ncbi:MAG: peptidase P60 [Ferrovum sp.]|jgi:proteasome lid subunit RPN8/RPN11|nr:peptidase P60 [Ferrovum sp.]
MIDDKILAEVRTHAGQEFPRECCGLVAVVRGKQRYVPCRNVSHLPLEQFSIHPDDSVAADNTGEIVMIVHSHPNRSPEPSEADRVGCESSLLPWLIVNHPVGTHYVLEPEGYHAPLIGRSFVHGVLDCYSLIEDYYSQVVDIDLPKFPREPEWWLKGDNLYAEGYPLAGFVEVEDLKEHDVLLMQIGAPVINHAAIYIGDGKIIQHCAGRLSSRDVYGGAWRRSTIKIVRHSALC